LRAISARQAFCNSHLPGRALGSGQPRAGWLTPASSRRSRCNLSSPVCSCQTMQCAMPSGSRRRPFPGQATLDTWSAW